MASNLFSGLFEGLQAAQEKRAQKEQGEWEQHRALAEDALRQHGFDLQKEEFQQSKAQSATDNAFREKKLALDEAYRKSEEARKKEAAEIRSKTQLLVAKMDNLSREQKADFAAAIARADTPEAANQLYDYFNRIHGQDAAQSPASPAASPAPAGDKPQNPLEAHLKPPQGQQGALPTRPSMQGFDPSVPFGGNMGAQKAALEAQAKMRDETTRLFSVGAELKESQKTLNEAKTLETKGKEKRASDMHPLDVLHAKNKLILDGLDAKDKSARTQESIARAAHYVAMTNKAKADTEKVRQEISLSRENAALMSRLPEILRGGNKSSVYKLKAEVDGNFLKVSAATEALRKERDALEAKITPLSKQFDTYQKLAKEAAQDPEHTAFDGKVNRTQIELNKAMIGLMPQIENYTKDAQVLAAHLAEMETLRTQAASEAKAVRDALKGAGDIKTNPGSVKKVAVPMVRVGNRTLPASKLVGKKAEELNRMQGRRPQGPVVHGPEAKQKVKAKRKPQTLKVRGVDVQIERVN